MAHPCLSTGLMSWVNTSAPVTSTDLHPLSFWSRRPKVDFHRKDIG